MSVPTAGQSSGPILKPRHPGAPCTWSPLHPSTQSPWHPEPPTPGVWAAGKPLCPLACGTRRPPGSRPAWGWSSGRDWGSLRPPPVGTVGGEDWGVLVLLSCSRKQRSGGLVSERRAVWHRRRTCRAAVQEDHLLQATGVSPSSQKPLLTVLALTGHLLLYSAFGYFPPCTECLWFCLFQRFLRDWDRDHDPSSLLIPHRAHRAPGSTHFAGDVALSLAVACPLPLDGTYGQ